MLQFPQFSPDVFTIPAFSISTYTVGPIAVRWYGLMFVLGFVSAWLLGRWRAGRTGTFTKPQFDEVLTFGIMGVVLGGRLGYVLFYQPAFYLANPGEIFMLWHGGMSFHGGLIGVVLAQWLTGRRYGKSFFQTIDFMAPLVPPGLF